MSAVAELIDGLRADGIHLSARDGMLVVRGPKEKLTPGALRLFKGAKAALLAELMPKPTGCAWREDKHGRLWFSDGTVYAPTADGWILVKHPSRRMVVAGTVEVLP